MATLITTKYLGATNNRGARIQATAHHGSEKIRVTVSYDYAAHCPHMIAVRALMAKLDEQRRERLGDNAEPYAILAGVGRNGNDEWANCEAPDSRGYAIIAQ